MNKHTIINMDNTEEYIIGDEILFTEYESMFKKIYNYIYNLVWGEKQKQKFIVTGIPNSTTIEITAK